MVRLLFSLIAIAAAVNAQDGSPCNALKSCSECLDPSLSEICGWCSPDPAQWANGSSLFQCMDHTSVGWGCSHLYSVGNCSAGYVCDQNTSQCVLTDPGEGDTLANCEASCTPTDDDDDDDDDDNTPPENYVCDLTSFQCVNSTGTDDSSGGQSEDECSKSCSDGPPQDLVGIWRGLNIQTGFELGEWVANIDTEGITYGPVDDPEYYAATVTQSEEKYLRFAYTSPQDMVGVFKQVSYSNPTFPTGPETWGVTLVIPRDESQHEFPPVEAAQALCDSSDSCSFDIFAMQQCVPWNPSGECDFSASVATLKANARRLRAGAKPSIPKKLISSIPKKRFTRLEDLPRLKKPEEGDDAFSDPCNAFSDCDSCLEGGEQTLGGVCGWCDGIITDSHGVVTCGADGNGCCGGGNNFLTCETAAGGGYRKYCPVMCDGVNSNNPTCRTATTPEFLDEKVNKFDDCDEAEAAGCSSPYPYCDSSGGEPVCMLHATKEECDADPQCDSVNPSCDADDDAAAAAAATKSRSLLEGDDTYSDCKKHTSNSSLTFNSDASDCGATQQYFYGPYGEGNFDPERCAILHAALTVKVSGDYGAGEGIRIFIGDTNDPEADGKQIPPDDVQCLGNPGSCPGKDTCLDNYDVSDYIYPANQYVANIKVDADNSITDTCGNFHVETYFEYSYSCDCAPTPSPTSFKATPSPTPKSGPIKQCPYPIYDTVWRGLRIDSGYQNDEWDFNIQDFSGDENVTGTITFSSKSTGQTYSGTYALGERIAGDSFGAAVFDVTLDSGDVLSGLVSTSACNTCNGPVVKYMYMGLGDNSTSSWDDAMGSSEQEWFLIACLDAGDPNGSDLCDFSSADPESSALHRMRASVRSRPASKK